MSYGKRFLGGDEIMPDRTYIIDSEGDGITIRDLSLNLRDENGPKPFSVVAAGKLKNHYEKGPNKDLVSIDGFATYIAEEYRIHLTDKELSMLGIGDTRKIKSDKNVTFEISARQKSMIAPIGDDLRTRIRPVEMESNDTIVY